MKLSRVFLALAATLTVVAGAARAATWEGDLLNVQLLSPNPQTVAFNGNFNVPAGPIQILGDPTLPLSIGATSVTFSNLSNASVALQALAIVKITDTTASRILNVQVNPASTITLGTSLISGGNFLQFDLRDANIVPSGTLILDVAFTNGETPSPVPAPASLPLLASGLVALAYVRFGTKGGRHAG